MTNSTKNPLSFVSGYVQDDNHIIVTAQIDELVEAGEPDSFVLKWKRVDYKWSEVCDLDWSATRVCVIFGQTNQIFVTGPFGRVAIQDDEGLREEDIDNSSNGVSVHGVIRDLQFIGKRLYVCGMGRQIYVRDENDHWVHRDNGVLQAPSTTEVTGFNSIDGLNEDDIYAVGFYGEIWRYHNQCWQKIESPTNVILNKVKVIRNDLVYISGQRGMLLVGAENEWKIIEHQVIKDQIWDIEWFQNALYLSTDASIFKLLPDDTLEPVDMNLGYKTTCGSLHAKNGLMVSIGRKHIVWTDDCLIWHEITPRPGEER